MAECGRWTRPRVEVETWPHIRNESDPVPKHLIHLLFIASFDPALRMT